MKYYNISHLDLNFYGLHIYIKIITMTLHSINYNCINDDILYNITYILKTIKYKVISEKKNYVSFPFLLFLPVAAIISSYN